MPRLWADTIDTHRRQVHDAILDATAELMAEHGPLSVAMSAIAERAGIGRATLYKYFPDVEAILAAWHARDFDAQLQQIEELGQADTATLADVAHLLQAHRSHYRDRAGHLAGTLAHALASHTGVIEDRIEPQIIDLLANLVTGMVRRNEIRADLDPVLLARWLVHVVHAPADLDDHAVAALLASSLAPPAHG